MIYLESIGKKEIINNNEKVILDNLSNMIKSVISDLSEKSDNSSSKSELFQYIIENTDIE